MQLRYNGATAQQSHLPGPGGRKGGNGENHWQSSIYYGRSSPLPNAPSSHSLNACKTSGICVQRHQNLATRSALSPCFSYSEIYCCKSHSKEVYDSHPFFQLHDGGNARHGRGFTSTSRATRQPSTSWRTCSCDWRRNGSIISSRLKGFSSRLANWRHPGMRLTTSGTRSTMFKSCITFWTTATASRDTFQST